MKRIVSLLPKKRHSLFFSATLAPNIVELAHSILVDPATVSIAPEATTADKVEQLNGLFAQTQQPVHFDAERRRITMVDPHFYFFLRTKTAEGLGMN